jgi:chemotaxis protein CheX
MNMEATESLDLDRIVMDVFQTMLSDEVFSVDQQQWVSDADRLTASVHFAGPKPGALMIECSKQDACSVAELLTGVHHDDVSEDVLDGLAEMANMVGGNLKSLLHAGAGLSMPKVGAGRPFALEVEGDTPHVRQAFACRDAIFWVTYVSEANGKCRLVSAVN